MRNSITAILFAVLSSALLASCSQNVGVPPPATGTALDYIWSSAQLSNRVTYSVVRNGTGTNHVLSSSDDRHIRDAALNDEVTMVLHASEDSVLIDSIGTNSIFSLPSGYFFGRVLPPDTSLDSAFIHDTIMIITTVVDSVKDTTRDTITQVKTRDTVVQHIKPGDTVVDGLLALYQPDLDSGASWQAGTIVGPGLGIGIPVFATVLDRVDSLRLKPASPEADSLFGGSFQIRYAPQLPGDSQTASFPVYWLAYYSKNAGPVLIEQYTLINGAYSVTQRAQLVSEEQ